MVRRVFILLLVLLPLAAGSAELSVEVEQQQVEMGKYLNARIVYTGKHAPGLADLGQWDDDFFVDRGDSDEERLAADRVRLTEHLRLYPRHAGEGLLESIALGGAAAPPLRIKIIPTVRKGIDGTPHWLPLPQQLWQGQTFEIGIRVARLHPSNRIVVETARFPGFDVQPLQRRQVTRNGTQLITLRWRLTPRSSGRLRITPPVFEQRGRGRWRYHLRPQAVDVLPLPAYIPPSVPVGRITLDTRLIGTTPLQWELAVSSNSVLPQTIQGIRTQLAHIAGTDADQVRAEAHRYRVTLPAWSWGLGGGPLVRLPYFDTRAGRLALAPPAWRAPRPFRYLVAATLLATGIAALYLSIRWLRSA